MSTSKVAVQSITADLVICVSSNADLGLDDCFWGVGRWKLRAGMAFAEEGGDPFAEEGGDPFAEEGGLGALKPIQQ